MTYELNWYGRSWAGKTAIVNEGPFHVIVQVVLDEHHDFTFMRGKFIPRFQEGAIKSPWRHERNTLGWFFPEETLRERINGWLQEEGYDIHMARKRAVETLKEDMRIARDGGDYIALGVTVIASLAATGTELATSDCWGIEVKNVDDPYIDQVAQEQIDDALVQAKEEIRRLKIVLAQVPD